MTVYDSVYSNVYDQMVYQQLVYVNDRVGAIFLIFGLIIAGFAAWLIFKYLILNWFRSNFNL